MAMKTLLLILLFSIPAFSQIEQVASSTDNAKGFPIAYFIDTRTIVFDKETVKFTGFSTGIKSWKEEFEVDPNFFIVSEIWADCSKRTFKELKFYGYDSGIVSSVFDKPLERQAPKGSVIATTLDRICKPTTKLKA